MSPVGSEESASLVRGDITTPPEIGAGELEDERERQGLGSPVG